MLWVRKSIFNNMKWLLLIGNWKSIFDKNNKLRSTLFFETTNNKQFYHAAPNRPSLFYKGIYLIIHMFYLSLLIESQN